MNELNRWNEATADQAFSNAKATGDVDGMTAALVYAALERNTGSLDTTPILRVPLPTLDCSVGLPSVLCTSINAVNPEIAAITRVLTKLLFSIVVLNSYSIQHQDPASSGAAEINKQSTLGLALQIAAIGGDPQTALEAGTFAPVRPTSD